MAEEKCEYGKVQKKIVIIPTEVQKRIKSLQEQQMTIDSELGDGKENNKNQSMGILQVVLNKLYSL